MKPAVKAFWASGAEAVAAGAGAAGVSLLEHEAMRAAAKEKASRVVRSMGEHGTSAPISGGLPSPDEAGASHPRPPRARPPRERKHVLASVPSASPTPTDHHLHAPT